MAQKDKGISLYHILDTWSLSLKNHAVSIGGPHKFSSKPEYSWAQNGEH